MKYVFVDTNCSRGVEEQELAHKIHNCMRHKVVNPIQNATCCLIRN